MMTSNKLHLVLVVTVASLALITINSCKDLSQNPYGQLTSENYYQNSEQLVSAYSLPYSYMQTHVYQTHFQVHEFTTDEATVPVRFGYVDQQGQWIRFHRHSWTSDDLWIQYEWENLYQGIGYCNQFLQKIEEVDVSSMNTSISKDRMIAEIRMVRALHYYWALSSFGNIPIVTKVGVASPETSPSSEVFNFIETEIQESIPDLPVKGDNGWYGRFSKVAAQALLAKLYLNAEVHTGTEHWQEVVEATNAILNANNYSLDSHWQDPFRIDNQNSEENIFVVPFDASNAQQFSFIQQNLHENILFEKYNVDYYGWHKISTQESFFNLYSSEDQRINQWIVGPQTYTDKNGDEQPIPSWEGDQLVITPEIEKLVNNAGGEGDGVFSKKYEIEEGGRPNMSNDMVIFRLADVMLMKAEALIRQNGGNATQEAVELVNQVRQRSFASDDPNATYTAATLTLDTLLAERGRELAYEMHRREDLIRFGEFTDSWWEKPESEEHRIYFPIPSKQMTANPNLEQNPGY